MRMQAFLVAAVLATGAITHAAAQDTTYRVVDPALGPILTDASGRTLYTWDRDTEPNVSTCTGACLTNWPLFTAQANDVGRYVALSDGDLFDMEYWDLEQAKLKKGGKRLPQAGRLSRSPPEPSEPSWLAWNPCSGPIDSSAPSRRRSRPSPPVPIQTRPSPSSRIATPASRTRFHASRLRCCLGGRTSRSTPSSNRSRLRAAPAAAGGGPLETLVALQCGFFGGWSDRGNVHPGRLFTL